MKTIHKYVYDVRRKSGRYVLVTRGSIVSFKTIHEGKIDHGQDICTAYSQNIGWGVPLGYKNPYPVPDHKTLILRPCSRLNVEKRYPVPDDF